MRVRDDLSQVRCLASCRLGLAGVAGRLTGSLYYTFFIVLWLLLELVGNGQSWEHEGLDFEHRWMWSLYIRERT